ncbi:PH domain-containing protein [Candidatus Uhrbacteria bacterium]|nr:PH domain-containing protein [Candidatus Uhrbacteria bacterium]
MKQLDKKAVWLFFLNALLGQVFMLVVFGTWLGVFLVGKLGFSVGGVLLLALAAILVLIGLSWIWARLAYRYYRYELREDGFRKEHGVIWKKYVTIPYDRIQNIDIHRGVFARLLGLSDLQIHTAGASAVVGKYGARGVYAEGRLPGLSKEIAEEIRDELVRRAREARSSGM